MMLHDRIVAAIRTSAAAVFRTMLGMEIGPGEDSSEISPAPANNGVVSFIGLAGAWAGTGSLACHSGLACRLCNDLLMTEATAVNEEVLDAVGELTNMIIGNVKTVLEQDLGTLGLSIPTVVFGKNFEAKTGSHAAWSVVRFMVEGEVLTIRMCLAPTARAERAPAYGRTCAV
jgi:chemotaxis protein CheX